jgi:SNF2 family DNA or RNA helicase
MQVFAELNERGDRCILDFRYDVRTKDMIKSVPGSKFVDRDHGGPHWQLPLDLTSMRILREKFGDGLVLGNALKMWGQAEVRKERSLRTLAVADDFPAEQMKLHHKLPYLLHGDGNGWPGLRPYQRADIAFLAKVTTGAMNLNEQRLGKTPEMIGTIYESDLEDGPHLIIGLQKSLDSVWRYEFERFTDLPVYTFSGKSNDNERAKMYAAVERHLAAGQPFVFCTTADMIRRGLHNKLELAIDWNTVIIDEFHKTGLSVPKNVFPKKAINLKAKRKFVMSGTPMGGKPIKLWGALHFLEPNRFTSLWRWADQWLEVTETYGKHKEIGGIKPGREDDFYSSLAAYAVRRLRTEVLPQLPPKQYIDVWCDMTPTQKKQYDTFAADAEIRIDEYHLSALSVLAEYTRLKQFSNARCEVEILSRDIENDTVEMKVKPTFDSGKLPYLMENLAGQGIDPEDPTGDSQAIVTSQFRETAEMLHRYFTEVGIPSVLFTGKVSQAESERVQRTFKAGNDHEGLRVVCMVTSMGTGITLDNVETVHEFDETWNPDDEEQVTDRAVNTTRNHQVTVYRYRSKGTIESMIYDVTTLKGKINKNLLDTIRQKYRMNGGV